MRAETSLPTANDRLKRRNQDILAMSLIGAVGFHVAVLTMFPAIGVPDWRTLTDGPLTVLPVPDIPIPEAPAPLTKPAIPVGVADAPVDATIVPFDWPEPEELAPPPPDASSQTVARNEFFTPYEVAPRLTNGADFQRSLLRAYPRALRDAGIGGVVTLLVHIDEQGTVTDARLSGSSGYDLLDQAALGVVDEMRFSPAINRDRNVPVWVSLPVEFRIR